MIKFKSGNLFNDFETVEAVINTVNCVGVMGKGVAKEFANRFPNLLREYKLKCSTKELDIGRNYVYEIPNYNKTKYIVNFPTKNHWRHNSKLEYIEKGLNDLVTVIKDFKIKSIVMPALGCGNGKLEWEVVKPLIIDKLSHLIDVEIIVYEPAVMKKNNIKKSVSKPRLTKDRKILLLLMNIYNETENNPKITYQEINALSYLMHYNNTEIAFDLKAYGPYSPKISPIISSLAKYYIEPLEKENEGDATPINIVTLDFPQKSEIIKDDDFKQVKEFLKGFELKRNMLILTIGLWMYSNHKVLGEDLYTLIVEWLKNNNLNFESNIVSKAVSRIEKTFMNVDILTLDL